MKQGNKNTSGARSLRTEIMKAMPSGTKRVLKKGSKAKSGNGKYGSK